MNIRPVSDLRNHYSDVEKDVEAEGPVFLTKNGRGSMVVMSFEQYRRVSDTVEQALDAGRPRCRCATRMRRSSAR